ncbi:MAG: UvrD-helicase domain-containing protein [Actinobacteria bacterium]|nr:UvrD-helicase domain-containing protein [Actinomycetota bacterium]
MNTPRLSRFDPAGPLPVGTAVLEASAGTGKTHAIAALATRYLADGLVDADRLAVISFSRIASAELRSRVRDRLRSTIAVLTSRLVGTLAVDPDETDQLLLTGTDDDVMARLGRLHRAVARLDAASIMTIHQFCQAMLDELGVLAEQDPQASLAEDLSLTVDQVVDDLYLGRYARNPMGPPFALDVARRLARSAVELPDAPLVPDAGLSGRLAERLAFATAVRDELAARKRRLGVYSFDDQLLRLRDALRGEEAGPRLDRLRARCEVVLVDEFQDTDPVQWEVLRAAFHGHVPLVLIGDPKQSIYAFRGADVHAYTDAVAAAGVKYSLDQNHRADAGVVHAVNSLFAGVTLGEGIEVPAVSATHATSRLVGPDGSPWSAPVRLRCLPGEEPVRAKESRERVIADLTAEVIALLDGDARVVDADGPRPLEARDISVLVSTNGRGREVAAALTGAGVPVAFSGADSIFATPAARGWLVLLRALEQPRRAAVRAAILTDFVGGDLDGLALADEERMTAWAGLLQGWSRVLSGQGVAALFAAVQGESGPAGGSLSERVLRRPRGERDLTDYRHLAEILHAQHTDGLRGQALVSWLEEAVERGSVTSDRIRRLETDRHAVQIMTVHKAKGLQFPVVLLPEAADLWVPDDEDESLAFHADGRRVLDVGGRDAPGRAERVHAHAVEDAEDRLRGLYVAVTRAQSQLVLWWSRTHTNTASSPLHRMLFRRRDVTGPPEASYPLDAPPGDGHPAGLAWLAEAGIRVEECVPVAAPHLGTTSDRPQRLGLAAFTRSVDPLWRRTSYSGLTEAVHARPPVALTAETVVDDEPADGTPLLPELAGVPSPMADLPGGTAFGSLVHQVLENLDWNAPDAELAARVREATGAAFLRYPVPGVTPETLAEALLPSLFTPLGRLTGGLPLAAIPVADRLSELNFEFALGTASSHTTLRDVADLMAAHLPADDPLAGYPAELAHPHLAGQVLRGFLTGSIDSVLRVPSPDGPRFVVVDYKTNRLGPAELTLDHYSEPLMVAEMLRTHYPLQAILYCVALHRFLSARLPGYDPATHLGGVGYLFVRGMGGREATGGNGVFSWFPPASLVVALSDLLADRRLP